MAYYRRCVRAILLLGWVFNAGPVGAQSPAARLTLEAGVAGSMFVEGRVPGVGMTLTIGSPAVALELGADWMEAGRATRHVDQVIWFYLWQVKHRVSDESSTARIAFSYGSAGWIQRTQKRREAVEPFGAQVVPALLPTVGLGVERGRKAGVSLRADFNLMIWWGEDARAVPRISAGLSIPVVTWPSP